MGQPTPGDRVEALVTGPLITVTPDATMQVIAETITSNSVGAVVVRGAAGVLGVVSERDLVAALADEETDPEVDRATDLMTPQPVAIDCTGSIDAAAVLMLDGEIRHLPVKEGDIIVGIVSIRDVLAAFRGNSA